jgi:uncharacterized protein (TIGR02246 family)
VSTPAARELVELERGFWDAAGDRERYAAGLADDALHVFPGWGVAGRAAVLDGVASAEPWQDVRIDDPRVVPLGEDAAALVYTAVASRSGQSAYRAAITSVYRRTDGGWELALHQQTPLAATS